MTYPRVLHACTVMGEEIYHRMNTSFLSIMERYEKHFDSKCDLTATVGKDKKRYGIECCTCKN